jgi:LysM repeat protein
MATPLDIPDAPACPLLGLAVDARTHYSFPHADHRCDAGLPPNVVEPMRQTRYCLSADFASCDRYRGWFESGAKPASSPTAVPASGSPAFVHVFRAGDSMARIAALYGLTVDQILEANNLAPSAPVVDGQRLRIPTAAASTNAPGAPGPRADRSG